MPPTDVSASTDAFEAHRRRLLGLAYRMLGSVASAEDAVQETWVRWSAATDVREPGAWLTTVCTRLCLDELRSARARRESHVGPWLPEPWVDEHPPEPGILGESLTMAFLLLLESLSARERAAFLLREVFEEDYEHIAEVLTTSPAAARQLVKRARTAIDGDRPRFDADPQARLALAMAFGAACATGDRGALERLLAEDVVATSDGGGRVHAARRPVHGRSAVARFLLGLYRKAPADFTLTPAWINGEPGMIGRVAGVPTVVVAVAVRDGAIAAWQAVLDPTKLAHLR